MEPPDEETKYCSNCKRDISASNFVMHEVHCRRNIVLCKKCNEPVPRSQMEEHQEEYHVLVPCECGRNLEKEALEEHKENGCRLRKVSCQYCELELASEKMAEHSNFCGSRTEKCEKCGQFVTLRDQSGHDRYGCQGAPQERVKQKVNNNPFIFGGNPYQQLEVENLPFVFPHEELLSDAAEPVPRELPIFRPTVMEELDSDRMIGQRRSKKNETTQRHNSKNERTVQPQSAPVDEDVDGAHAPHRRQVEEDLLLALRLAHEEVEADGPSLDPRLRHTSADPTPEELYPHFLASLTKGSQGQVEENLVGPPTVPVPPDSDEVQIPCEICGQPIPLDALEMHQTHCLQMEVDVDPSTRQVISSDSDEELGNPFDWHLGGRGHVRSPVEGNFPLNNLCRPPIHAPFMDIVDDVAELTLNERNGDGSRGSFPIPDAEVSLVPCEFCNDQFPFVNIALHQAACDNAPQNRQIQDDMREYGFNSQGGGIDVPDSPHQAVTEEQLVLGALPSSELNQWRPQPDHQQSPSSLDNVPRNGPILGDQREYDFDHHGDQIDAPAALDRASAEEQFGLGALPLSELNRVKARPNHPQKPRGFSPGSSALDGMFDSGVQPYPKRTSSKEPLAPISRRTNPLDHSTRHQGQSIRGSGKQDNRFGAGEVAWVARSHLVKARTVPGPERVSAPKDPEPRRRSKHQADPFSNHVGTEDQTEGHKVNFVSRPKTLDMLQKSGQKKAQNKDYGRNQSFPAPVNDKSPNRQALRRSPNSAFDRPTARVVSTEKTLNMQRKLRNGGQHGLEKLTANGLPTDARANGHSGSDRPNGPKSDTEDPQVRRPDGSRLKTVDMLTGTKPRGDGSPMTSSKGHRVARTESTAGSRKVPNADVESKEGKSDLASHGVSQRSQRGGANPAASESMDGNPDENTFELSSQVIRAMRSKASPGSTRDRDSRQIMTTDPSRGRNGSIRRDKRQNGSDPNADSSANYSWQEMFPAPPTDRTVNSQVKRDARSGEPGPAKHSFPKNGMKTTPKSTNHQGSTPPSNLSPSNPLPASFQVNGTAMSEKEDQEAFGGGDQSRAKRSARQAPNIEEDFTSKMIFGTQAFMSSTSSRTGEGKLKKEQPTSWNASTNGNVTKPRCSANFGDGSPQQPRGRHRARHGDRTNQDRTEKFDGIQTKKGTFPADRESVLQQVGPKPIDDAKEEEKERKAELARQRQEHLMAKMSAMQKKLLEGDSQLSKEMEVAGRDRAGSIASMDVV